MVDAMTVVVSLLSSIGGGSVVALVNHWLTVSREKSKKAEDFKILRRINTWKSLEKASLMRRQYDAETERKLKDEFDYAFAELMLLGTAREIELAERYAKNANVPVGQETPELADLLNELRTTIRGEMKLEQVNPMPSVFRLHR